MNIDHILEPHERLYVTNPWFRQGADTAFQILEWTLKGLAAEAEQKQQEMERHAQLIQHMQSQPFKLPADWL